MTRRDDQKAATRRVILDAACSLFDEKGYDGTTMRLVAEHAGVALGTIFVHFPDKPALLLAAFDVDVGAVVEEAFATLPADDLRAQLLHVSGRLYEFYARRPRLGRVLIQNALFLEGSEQFSTGAQVWAFVEGIERLFTAAVERGDLRGDLAVNDAALGFFADYFLVLIGALQQADADVAGQQEMLARLLDLRIAGMRPWGGVA
jgi:AcrR family transcriptional regulator